MSDIKLDQVPAVAFEFSTADSVGVIAQETGEMVGDYYIDTSTMAGTTVTVTGTSYNWSSGSSITITDPYEEMEKRLAKLEQIIAEEAEIRASHPAVKMAYDEYRLLLVLANRHLTDRD
jgi:hypothetical protein